MPTVRRFSGCKITMYFGDHRPPHFHIITRDGREGRFLIETFEQWDGELTARDTDEALLWAEENRERLYALWVEYSEEEES